MPRPPTCRPAPTPLVSAPSPAWFNGRTAAFQADALSVIKVVIYRNVDKKIWEQIAREHQGLG